MKGHIRERSPGKWAIVLDLHDPETGKRRRKWHSFSGTKRQAQSECARLITELKGGNYVEPTRQTLAEYLDEWLTFIKPSVAAKTHERYGEICRKGIVPQIGADKMADLKVARIDAAFSKALTEGRRDGTGGLSPRTVHHMRRVLIKALGQAVTWGRLAKNPAQATTPPKVERKQMLAYDAEQTATLLDFMRPTRLYVPVLLAVMCGMRRGEIIALKWQSVDLEARQVAVVVSAEQTGSVVTYKAPKNNKARTVALSRWMVEELKAHRARQAEELLRIGVRLRDDMHVVTQADGNPIQPRSLTHEWMRLIQRSPLPRIRFHDLRHTHATQLLAAGVHPKIASERLGHSTIGITLDLYSHVMPGMQADAAEQVDAAIRKAVKPST